MKGRIVEIFKAIVDEFIQTAEPVGSKALMTKYNLPYSSATIRNDMQLLEEMGYLEKTHTSSGRIPSTKGYQYYCENLLEDKLDKKITLALNSMLSNDTLELEEAIQESCNILAQMTNLATGALGPDSSLQRLEHIKLFPIDERSAVCVFITNTGHTETKNFRFEEDISINDIQKCTEILNSRLKDTLVDELPHKLKMIKPILESNLYRHEMLFSAFLGAFIKFASDNFYYSKTSNILYQPEYSDIERLKQLMEMLDDNNIWRKFGSGKSNQLAIRTSNGAELSWVDDFAIVKRTFKVSDNEEGQLMVVGPPRMDYGRIVSMLEYVTALIEKMYGRGGSNGKY